MSGPISFTHWSWSFYSWLWLAQTPAKLVYRLYGLSTDPRAKLCTYLFLIWFLYFHGFSIIYYLEHLDNLISRGLSPDKKSYIFWNLCERSMINTSQWWLSHPRTFLPQLSSLHLIKYNLAWYSGSSCEVRVRNA